MRTRILVTFVVLLLAAGVVARADRTEPVAARMSFAAFPMEIGEWHGVPDAPFTKQVLDVLRVDDYVTRTYFGPDHSAVGLYVGYWRTQRQGDTIHSPLNCLPGAGWEPISHATIHFAGVGGSAEQDQSINRYVIQKGIDRQLVVYWYQSHGRMVASEYWSKFYLIADAVRLNRTDGAIVRVIATLPEDPDAARHAEDSAMRFVNVLVPQLDGFLPR
jgi:EpsI family protein